MTIPFPSVSNHPLNKAKFQIWENEGIQKNVGNRNLFVEKYL